MARLSGHQQHHAGDEDGSHDDRRAVSRPGQLALGPFAAGQDAFRLAADWGCAEPQEGRYDQSVFEEYATACDASRARGVEPVLVLHHHDLPAWLGPRFWLGLDAPARFAAWASVAAARLGGHCRQVVTFVEPNAVAWGAWVTGVLPPGRVGAVGDLVRSLDHMLTAHVLAHAAVHVERADAVVDLEIRPLPVYELDGLLFDVLASRAAGIDRYELRDWLTERRRDWYRRRTPATLTTAGLRRIARSAIPLDQALPRTVAAVFDGVHEWPVDESPGPADRPR